MTHLTAPTQSIRMGEIAVARRNGVLRTLLGSCIGIALYDGAQRIGGLAHVVLPDSKGKGEPPGKFMDTAIPALLEAMSLLGERPVVAKARIAGGANMFATKVTDTVGRRNIEACERLLEEHGIPILARHCGGEKGRRMLLDPATGRVSIEIVGMDSFEL